MMGTDADLYICGHRHTWGITQFEMPDRMQCPLAVRCRGYKRHDFWAQTKGYQEDSHGSSVLIIIDPTATGPGKVMAFADTDQGVRVLKALRGTARKSAPQFGKRKKSR
jgi:hypothetical protein